MKRFVCFLLAGLMVVSLCGCGSSAKYSDTAAAEPQAFAVEASYDMAVAEAAGYGLSMTNSAAMPEAAEVESEGDLPDVDPSKIIYSADATVETTDFDAATAKVAELVAKYDGWIESSSINGANYYNTARGRMSYRSAYYVMRIPSAKFDALMGTLGDLGNVPYTHTYTENVTSQYYDTQARLTAYETQEARLLEMMELAESVEDVISIEEKLTELRYQIEALQSKLNNWDREVSYSTVNLSIEEVEKYTPESVSRPGYGERLWSALKSGVEDTVEYIGDLLIIFVAALPALIIIAAVVFVAVKLVKRGKKKRAAKKAAAMEGADKGEK